MIHTDNTPWVVLIDYSALENEDMQKFPFHIEPFERFANNPPHREWKLHRICKNAFDAFAWLDSNDAISLFSVLRKQANHYSICNSHKSKTEKSLRIDVLERDNYRCVFCGRSARDGVLLEIDHIVPRSKGGGDNIDNLQVLCFDCNRGKRDKMLKNNLTNNGFKEVL